MDKKELYAHYILNPVKSREQIQTLALPTTEGAQVLRSSATLIHHVGQL